MEGWLYTIQSSQAKMTAKQKTTDHKVMLLQRMGGCIYEPPKNPSSDYQYR